MPKLTTEEFRKRSFKIHGSRYDYSMVDYKKLRVKICIICPKHGEFWQLSENHLNGHGCKKCDDANKKIRYSLTNNQFLEKAVKTHGAVYDYSEVDYKNNHTKVSIHCKIHGPFLMRPGAHLYLKQGCPKCGQIKGQKNLPGGYNIKTFERKPELKNNPAILYFLEFDGFVKIGITRCSVKERFWSKCKYGTYSILKEIKMDLYTAWLIEQKILKQFKINQYIPENFGGGKSECFNVSAKTNILKELKNASDNY